MPFRFLVVGGSDIVAHAYLLYEVGIISAAPPHAYTQEITALFDMFRLIRLRATILPRWGVTPTTNY